MAEKEPVRIVVRVQPNAGRNEVLGFQDNILRMKIAAPPVKGKANQELITFLSDILGIRKSNLTIEKGTTGKKKVISITGLTQTQIIERATGHPPIISPKLL